MTFRVLADENVDHRVVFRLEHYGHDAVHVDLASELGKGSDDHCIAQHSLESDRLILTNDLDFLTDFSTEDYRGVLFITEDTLTTSEIAEIVHEISKRIEQEHIEDLLFVSSSWLDESK